MLDRQRTLKINQLREFTVSEVTRQAHISTLYKVQLEDRL